jgi:hypothetical protein
MENKKGQTGIVIFFVFLAIILLAGFVFAIVTGALTYASGVIAPVFTGLGTVEGANLSQAAQYTVGTANTLVQAAPWIIGFAYLFALLASILFVLSYDKSMNPMWMGGYFVFMIALVLLAIIISNAYQDIYQGTDEIALSLQSMTILSYLILYSPHIFTIITVVAGIFLFAGKQGETVQSGYGV